MLFNRAVLVYGLALLVSILPACQPSSGDAPETAAQQASAGPTEPSQPAASQYVVQLGGHEIFEPRHRPWIFVSVY